MDLNPHEAFGDIAKLDLSKEEVNVGTGSMNANRYDLLRDKASLICKTSGSTIFETATNVGKVTVADPHAFEWEHDQIFSTIGTSQQDNPIDAEIEIETDHSDSEGFTPY